MINWITKDTYLLWLREIEYLINTTPKDVETGYMKLANNILNYLAGEGAFAVKEDDE